MIQVTREDRPFFSRHVLEVLVETEHVQCYRLREPGTRNCLIQITATPEGICIQGDYTPEDRHGTCAAKPLAWFAGDLSPDYLAEKFLHKGWHAELARTDLKALLDAGEIDAGLYTTLTGATHDGEAAFYTTCTEVGRDPVDGVPGWGYDPNAVYRLSKIQRTFACLWAARTVEQSGP